MGNRYLKWAFSEAAVLSLRAKPEGQRHLARLQKKYGKGKALSILAHEIGRATYQILTRRSLFDRERFYQS